MHTCVLLDTADLLGSVFPLLDLLPGLVDRGLCQSILQARQLNQSAHTSFPRCRRNPETLDVIARHIAEADTQSCTVDKAWVPGTELRLTLMSLYLGSNFFAESTVS